MKADERHALETNALAAGAKSLVEKAKTGQLVPTRTLAIAIAVLIVGGVGWYVLRTSRSAAATTWAKFADLAHSGGQSDLEEFSKVNGADAAGRLARLEVARFKLGPDGIAKLPLRDFEQRNKGVASIEAARGELTALADEFAGDKTLQATCLIEAAEAELALVGIAKTAGGSDYRGTVAGTVALLKKAADAVGPTTAAGEALVKRATELEANKAQVEEVGVKLNGLLTPPPAVPPPSTDGLGTTPKVTPPPPIVVPTPATPIRTAPTGK